MHKFNLLLSIYIAKDVVLGSLQKVSALEKKKKRKNTFIFLNHEGSTKWWIGVHRHEQIQYSEDVSQAEILMEHLVLIWMLDQKI